MNKIKILFFIFLILLLISGCGKKTVEISYVKQTVRAFGYSAAAKYPLETICTSRAELNTYLESFNYIYAEDVTGQAMLAEAAAKYDDAFFKTKALILVLLSEPSSSITHSVNMIYKNGSVITVELSRHAPPTMTADMALWHLIFEVDKSVFKTGDSVQVSVTE